MLRILWVARASRVLVAASRRHGFFQMPSQPRIFSIFAAASRILKDREQFKQ